MGSRDITKLHPCVAAGALELIDKMARLGRSVVITSTYRSAEEQDALYAQGRTTTGSIVTNARGGESVHNYALAFDIAQNIRGQEYSDTTFFQLAGACWIDMGGEWGGEWRTFADPPHMQYTAGLTLYDLQKGKSLPLDAKMPWESEVNELTETEIVNIVNARVNAFYKEQASLPVSEWAKDNWDLAVSRGILDGTSPRAPLTREQLAAVLARLDLVQ